MDSGMAAIQGASLDNLALGKKCVIVLDIATSHTVGAAFMHGEVAGLFEYHTSDITRDKIDRLIDGIISPKRYEGGAHVRLHHT